MAWELAGGLGCVYMTACAQFRIVRHSGVHANAADCVSAMTSSQFCFRQIRKEQNNFSCTNTKCAINASGFQK